jgi:hypothetical protein
MKIMIKTVSVLTIFVSVFPILNGIKLPIRALIRHVLITMTVKPMIITEYAIGMDSVFARKATLKTLIVKFVTLQ